MPPRGKNIARGRGGQLQGEETGNSPDRSPAVNSFVMKLPIILRPGEDGWTIAECPVIPGCISQGRSREEALSNIEEAIELCLESREEEGWELPSEYEWVDLTVENR